MTKWQKIFSWIVMSVVVLGAALPALAAPTSGPLQESEFGLSYAGNIGLGSRDVRDTAAQIIRVAMGLLGIVAVVIVLIGGFKWMTAGGNDDQVGEAKKWIFSGILRLAIIMSAYALASYVLTQLRSATVS
jgi:hypothetical protein